MTEKLEMITTVMILPQRQTVLAAKQAAEAALLSNNRFRLGIGVGWNELEYVGLNETFNNRGRRQAEQVEVMQENYGAKTPWIIPAITIASTKRALIHVQANRFRSGSAVPRPHY